MKKITPRRIWRNKKIVISWRDRSLVVTARQVRLRWRRRHSETQAARCRSVDRSVYGNVTVIVVVVVLVCVLCNVSPMISHLFWSLEDLLSDPKSRLIAYNYRRQVSLYLFLLCSHVHLYIFIFLILYLLLYVLCTVFMTKCHTLYHI